MNLFCKCAALAVVVAMPPMGASADGHEGASFFLTSIGLGDGANLGGLAGADAHCTALAETAGITGSTWAAYLSDDSTNARDRIGSGPWVNHNGVTVATDVANLHDAAANALSKENSVSESGAIVNGRGDKPNMHDILTGSDAAGMSTGANCANWTSNGEGAATVGHHDRTGGGADPTSWVAAHPSRGCSQSDLQGTGGNGLFYCFAK
ncbi:hypothetical protein BCF46_1466 [Litoreibacter meonggei]|uniref:Collagenase NC10/endostatin n=1 Tax=Litoreibacter meonggei TaxID=1049199 RepID=A0A497WYI4_9RHOB|nr:hypothetical protein [Litoreibacter meonggei]RLJ59318.1 hypothetical protein BCF46_1466 [Litoreibacter meonggei]